MKMHKNYDSTYLEFVYKLYSEVKKYSLSLLKLRASSIIVDLGCGIGLDTLKLAANNKKSQIFGIDHDIEMLNIAKKKTKPNINYLLSQADSLPFENDYVDAMLCDRIFQHLSNVNDVISQINRVLKNNGMIVIVETDWMSMCFNTPFIETERKILDHKSNVDIKNGLSSRLLLNYFENYQIANFKNFSLSLNSLIDANYIFGLYRVVKNSNLTQNERDVFLNYLNNCDENRCFLLTWNVVVYQFFKS